MRARSKAPARRKADRPRSVLRWVGTGLLAALVIGGIAFVLARDRSGASNTSTSPTAPPGKVWSDEHGHWHDAPAAAAPSAAAPPAAGGPYAAPSGASAMPAAPDVLGLPLAGGAPDGKVWSEKHGHWHDPPAKPTPPPSGPAPPGKVWSAEHGHWHDAPGPAAAAPTPATAGEVLWSE